MLYELYQHVTTPCPRPLKQMGYLRELIGMAARHRRCRAAWAAHLECSRDWIVAAMEDCPGRGRVVVLGSGLLYDVPLAELCDHFDEVVLVDILHMPAARKAVKPWPNVSLVGHDITGYVGPLHGAATGPPPSPGPADMPLEGANLVISLNVLSQLPVLPQAFAAKRGHGPDPEIGRALMRAHLVALEHASARVCLITEVEHRLCRNGEVIEKADPLDGVEIPGSMKTRSADWDWRFAPHPERHRQYDLIYGVRGFVKPP